MQTALPPGTNHHAASTTVARAHDNVASSATAGQTAPCASGPAPVATVTHPATSKRSTMARR